MLAMPTRPATTSIPRCSACGEVVGVYERAIFLLDDGSVVDGSALSLDRTSELVAAYHASCSPGAPVP
jgi:hypothetical protein